MKVYLQYPLKISDSQYYKSIIDNPSEGIEYLNKQKTGMIVNEKRFKYFGNLKRIYHSILNKIPLPIINAHYTKNKDFDLIHCAHCLSLNKSPWVADIEFASQMWGGVNLTNMRKKIVRKLLMSKHCKKILAWTKDTEKDILNLFPEIKNKVEVVYYAMPIQKQIQKNNNEITLFFSGRHFYAKGGLHATEVTDRLTKKYPNVKGIINGAIPKEIIEGYSKNKKIKFLPLVSYNEILKVFQQSDIFIYPGYSDSLGFVFIEAMAYGLPIVTIDGHCRKEIISKEQGFIIDRPLGVPKFYSLDEDIIKKLINKTEILIKDKRMRDKMSKSCLEEIRIGKFSIARRNKQLKKIYKEALR